MIKTKKKLKVRQMFQCLSLYDNFMKYEIQPFKLYDFTILIKMRATKIQPYLKITFYLTT